MGSSCGGIWQVPWDENETCGLHGESCMTVQGTPLHLLSAARTPPSLKVHESGPRCGSGFIIITLLVLPGGQGCAWRRPGPLCTAAAAVSFFLNLPFIEHPLCASSVRGAFHTLSQVICVTPKDFSRGAFSSPLLSPNHHHTFPGRWAPCLHTAASSCFQRCTCLPGESMSLRI